METGTNGESIAQRLARADALTSEANSIRDEAIRQLDANPGLLDGLTSRQIGDLMTQLGIGDFASKPGLWGR